MKHMIYAGALVLAVMAFQSQPAQAQVGHAPWCAVIDIGTGAAYWDCQYRTVWDCGPNVLAGNRGTCNPNPGWVANAPDRPRARHKRHARQH